MAKGKHSTALFEVINSGKRPPGGLKSATGKPLEGKAAAASLMRTPKWWFKAAPKPGPDVAPAAVSNDPTANVTAATLTRPRAPIAPSAATTSPVAASDEPTRSEPARGELVEPVEPVDSVDGPSVVVRDYSDAEPILAERFAEPEPEVRFADSQAATSGQARSTRYRQVIEPEPIQSAAPSAAVAAPASRHRATGPSRSAIHVGVDRDRQEINLRMRYTAAVVGSFVILVMIASAYVIGRHMAESASAGSRVALNGLSTRDLKGAPAQPGVMEVGRDRARLATAKIDGNAAQKAEPDPFEDAPIDSAGIADRNANPNYLNFVLITTFPPEKSEPAIKARDFLCAHGITCTLERDVPGEPAHWLSVVGTRGFPHKFKDGREYLAYREAIIALNDKFPAKSSFNRFDPMPFKWDGH